MTEAEDNAADAALERLLAASALTPPDDFLQRVMTALPPQQRVLAEIPAPAAVSARPRPRWRRWLEAAALTGGALLGLSQLLAYVFGLWLATSTA